MRKTEDEHVDIPELIGMVSQDGEQVQFLKALKVNVQKGVEVWLKEILFEMMKISLTQRFGNLKALIMNQLDIKKS